jgi:DNA adenine methylase
MAYNGGKGGNGTYQRIINLMPPHRVYIEPFLGAGAVMRHKCQAEVNIGVELDPKVVRMWEPQAGVDVIEGDGLQYLLERQWIGGELVYCDPPYVVGSRTSRDRLYRYEMTDSQHLQLLAFLNTLRAAGVMVMLSGYYSKLYERELRGWHLTTFGSMTRRGMGLEHLWCTFPAPMELHDYRYLGADYRERERIKRKIGRWRAKLEGMPKLERQALLAALAESEYLTGDPGDDRSPVV